MRRNGENTYSYIQAIHQEILDMKAELAKMNAKVDGISHQVQTATFQTVMQGPDMSEFFPVKTPQQLETFMDRSHPEWPSRRSEFYNFLFTCVSDCKKTFVKGLLKSLFTREYMWKVKWPAYG